VLCRGLPTMPFGSTEGLQLSRSRLYYRPKWVAKERRSLKEWVDSEQVGWRSSECEPPPDGGHVLAIAKIGPPHA